MGIIVQKYGGTSVGDLDRIRNVAKRVAKTYDEGHDVVVVLSAMSGVTDTLITMAKTACESPDKRELDVLMSTGEQTTVALMAFILTSSMIKMNILDYIDYSSIYKYASIAIHISYNIIYGYCYICQRTHKKLWWNQSA